MYRKETIDVRTKKRIFLFILLTEFMTLSAHAVEPLPTNILGQNNYYGRTCSDCSDIFSSGFCSETCCSSCSEEASQTNVASPQSICTNICSQTQTAPTEQDLDFVNQCDKSSSQTAKCLKIMKHQEADALITVARSYERRVNSCKESIELTLRNCSTSALNNAYPEDLFSLSKQIVDSLTCDLGSVEQFDLRAKNHSPEATNQRCETSFKACKMYCFDESTVISDVNGILKPRTNLAGEEAYQEKCQPTFVDFTEQKDVRDSFISQAHERLMSCQMRPNDTSDSESPKPNQGKDRDKYKGIRAALNDPEVALGRISQTMASIQPFLPRRTGSNYNPSLYSSEIAGSGSMVNGKQVLSNEELYGQPYEGSNDLYADDYDYLDGGGSPSLGTDHLGSGSNPQSNRNNSGRQNPGFTGGSGGGLNGMGTNSRNQGSASKSSGGRRRARPKDKTLFGKLESEGSGSFPAFSNDGSSPTKNFGTVLRDSRGRLVRDKKGRVFNASKYHDAIMASYKRPQNNRAHRIAERRAAGLNTNSFSERRANGYTLWNIENAIHPEKVSIFIQTKICYHTKFYSNFSKSCEFSK